MVRPNDTLLNMVGYPVLLGFGAATAFKALAAGNSGGLVDMVIIPSFYLAGRLNTESTGDERLIASSVKRRPGNIFLQSVNAISLGLQRSLVNSFLTGVSLECILWNPSLPIKALGALGLALSLSHAQAQGITAKYRLLQQARI
jgi:hypothetical protein